MKARIILILIASAIVSCAPLSKDSYMERYAKFMTEVSQNASSYTENDWIKHDKQYYKYSEELYQKFCAELTTSDKLTLAGYKIKYSYYRGLCKSSSWLMDTVNSIDVDSAVSGIKSFGDDIMDIVNYAENEMSKMDGYIDNLSEKIDNIVEQLESDAERSGSASN